MLFATTADAASRMFWSSVVLLQADDLRFWKILLKLQNVAEVGAAPGIDRLVLVAYRAEVVPRAREQPHQFILRPVRVLVFRRPGRTGTCGCNIRAPPLRLQQAQPFQQQVVEVERIRLAQLLAVLLEDVRDFSALDPPTAGKPPADRACGSSPRKTGRTVRA